jgi:beta-galactosidase
VKNDGLAEASFALRHSLLEADGRCVAAVSTPEAKLSGKGEAALSAQLMLSSVHCWSLEDPYLYTVRTEVLQDGAVVDSYCTRTGFRDICFTADEGFFLNGKRVEIRGVNQHQDHPGVGSAIPDALQVYRLKELKKLGVNAVRTSHNPATPELLDACDSLGILVLEENRLTGINTEHRRLLRRMVERDRNHPSIILWSVGNEEWGIEWTEKGRRVAASMQA